MAKQEIVQNTYENEIGGQLDKYDRKYLKYLENFKTNKLAVSVFEAFRTKNLATIEDTLKSLAESTNTYLYLIGTGCLIIDRERLYEEIGCNSYLEYAQKRLFPELRIPDSTLSDAKIIMETYFDNIKPLKKAGFKLEGNAHKLRFLEAALQNHAEEDVYNRLVNDSLRGFAEWAKRSNVAILPEPEQKINIEIKANKLYINGKNILIFPKDLPEKARGWISTDLAKTLTIREGGGEPYITETYGKGEQIAIENFKKKYRAKK
jgi:hypothetical protein